jgi:hypothetical protein
MSAASTLVSGASEPTLFDSLAQLVPADLQAAYYRVLAHTRELSPDDEMLRILEAMGVLALLTRQTPMAMAEERERLQEVLGQFEQCTSEAQEKMLTYLNKLEARIKELPREIERSLNPSELAKLLGESIRQQFLQSGLPRTADALQASTVTMARAQESLSTALQKLCDPRYGVLAEVESANLFLTHSLENRAKKLDHLLLEVKHDILRIWIPMLCAAALVIGLISGTAIQRWRDTPSNDTTVPSPATVQVDPVPESKVLSDKGHGKPNRSSSGSGHLRSVEP